MELVQDKLTLANVDLSQTASNSNLMRTAIQTLQTSRRMDEILTSFWISITQLYERVNHAVGITITQYGYNNRSITKLAEELLGFVAFAGQPKLGEMSRVKLKTAGKWV